MASYDVTTYRHLTPVVFLWLKKKTRIAGRLAAERHDKTQIKKPNQAEKPKRAQTKKREPKKDAWSVKQKFFFLWKVCLKFWHLPSKLLPNEIIQKICSVPPTRD